MIVYLKKMAGLLTVRWKISALVFLLMFSLMLGQHSPSDFVAGGVLTLSVYLLIKSLFGSVKNETAQASGPPSQVSSPTPSATQPWQVAPVARTISPLPENLFSEVPLEKAAPKPLDASIQTKPEILRPPPVAAFKPNTFG
jgi:hypothetical protein